MEQLRKFLLVEVILEYRGFERANDIPHEPRAQSSQS